MRDLNLQVSRTQIHLGTSAITTSLLSSRTLVTGRGAWTLLDQAFVSLTNFSTGLVIGRFCSRGELGQYMLGYSIILFVTAIQQMLISSPYTLIRPRLNATQAKRYTSGAYTQQIILGVVLCIILLLAALSLHLAHSELTGVMLSLAFASPLFLFKEMFRRVCFAHLNLRSALLVDFATGIIQISVLVALALKGVLSAPTGIYGIGLASGALTVAWFLRNWRRFNFRIQDARDVLQRNWNLGRWIFGSQILWAASVYSYPWLISRMHGHAEAGVWAVCFGITAFANPLALGLQNFIEPRISHAFADGGIPLLRTLVLKATAVFTVSMLAFSALMLIVANHLAILLYGAQYAGNGFTIFILALGFTAGAAGFAVSCGFFATGKGKLDLKISLVYPIVVCAVGFPLVRDYGSLGAAASLLIGYTLASSIRASLFLTTFRKTVPSYS